MSKPMYARNDWAAIVRLKTVTATGRVVALDTGLVSAFLSASNEPDATAIDPSLVGTVTYTGASGDWLVVFDGAALDETLMDPVAALGPVYLILQRDGDVQAYADTGYQTTRPMTVS